LVHFVYLLLLCSAYLFWADKIEAAEPPEFIEYTQKAESVEHLKTPTLDFIYVNANIGEAAGGHTAIRLGSTLFHFQFFPDGKFLLERDSWQHFRYIYNELRNRTIFISRVSLTQHAYTQLRNHFTRLLITQQQVLNHLHSIENERDLLMRLSSGDKQLPLEIVGLFDYASAEDESTKSLSQIVHKVLGEDFLTHKRNLIETQLAKQMLELGQLTTGSSWPARFRALLLEREFYKILETGMSLASDSILSTSIGIPGLTLAQQKTLLKYREQLVASVIGLMQSQRPDRARALLLQTARYLVVDKSLQTNMLLTLDPFSSRAGVAMIAEEAELEGLHAQFQYNATQAQKDFFKTTENISITYTILESTLGRLFELEDALRKGGLVRVEPGSLLPARNGMVTLDYLYKQDDLFAILAENQETLFMLKKHIDEKYAYDLINQNCVTDLLRSLNSAFENKLVGEEALGGWLEPNQGLVFIPNQFYTQIAKHFPVQEEEIFPSRRLRHLQALYTHGNALQLWLRESNVLSTTLYTHRTEDTHFLFFTDDNLYLRPVLGAANILWGAVNSVAGVFSLPVDGGTRLHQGLRGMFYSLPELMFGNIRKGTYGFAETTTVGP